MLWLVRALAVLSVVSLGSASSAIATDGLPTDDASVIAKLPAEQRANLTVLSRDGRPQAAITAEATDTPAPVALAPSPTAKTPAPATKPLPSVKPIVPAVPVSAGGLLAADGRTFVPTVSGGKPSDRPTPPAASQHDLAYAYAHRFDTVNNDDVVIPGVPVRAQASSPFDTQSGAFHGVRARNGYSAVRATVSIPCGASHFQTGPGYNLVTGRQDQIDQETGYIYVGGWGAGGRGAAVDAGLQKSSAQSEHDDYAFYWKYDRNQPVTSDTRFPCGGPDVTLELYPASPHLLIFAATGVTTDGRRETLTIAQHTTADDGWVPSGGSASDGIILKRIISIAQPPAWRTSTMGRLRWSSGTYFGIGGPSDPTPKIVWRDCEVGRVIPPRIVPTYHRWTQADTWTPSAASVYTDWPPRDVLRAIDPTSTTCDVVGLFLRTS